MHLHLLLLLQVHKLAEGAKRLLSMEPGTEQALVKNATQPLVRSVGRDKKRA